MGRLPRFDAAGVVQHVWAGGAGPGPIFDDDADRLTLRALAADTFARLGVRCLLYCLMTTHYHFLVRTREPALSAAIQRVNGNYARSFNRRHARRGHLFGERFGSRFVQTQADLLGVVRYVALNPLDIPGIEHPADWPWSSYGSAVAGRPDPLADNAELLRLVGGALRLRAFVERNLDRRAA